LPNDFSHDNSGRKRATESISFRLDENDLGQLRDVARTRRLSLNSLVSQVIDSYLRLWLFEDSFGFFAIGKDMLLQVLAKLSDRQIEEIAKKTGVPVHKDIMMYLYGRINEKTVQDYLNIFGKRFHNYKHFDFDSRHTITIYHDMDKQFSKLYYEIVKDILALANITPIDSERDVGDNAFSIIYDSSSSSKTKIS
jgi:hypothetical protein